VDANLAVRCPFCRAVDWFRDGFVIVEREGTGDVVRVRVMRSDPILALSPWACAGCAFEVPIPSRLATELQRSQLAFDK
jgi:hypothetical protein